MIDLCINELHSLDLKVNIKKSTSIRIGKYFKKDCVKILVDGLTIPWMNTITYLGVVLKSALKLSLELKPARAKFYRAFNSLYSKISKANEYLITTLVGTFCVPVIMFSLEAFELNASTLSAIDFPMYCAMSKIFKTVDHNVLGWCMFYMNVLPLKYIYYCKKIRFLTKLKKTKNDLLSYMYNLFGKVELEKTFNQLHINDSQCVKTSLNKLFENSLF